MILEFIKTYWREILDVVAFVGALILFIVKKKPVKVVDTIKQNICTWLPGVVCAAENTKLKGEAKMNFAIDLLFNLFASDYLTREEFDNKYLAFSKSQIEAILSTPKKKGENDGTKN